MTKAELQRSHDAMVRFLTALCRYSDNKWRGNREPDTEENYQKARRLLKRAGCEYKPPRLTLTIG